MILTKILIIVAIAIVFSKIVASLLKKDDIPFLNQLVTIILSLFIAFELFQLGRALFERFA